MRSFFLLIFLLFQINTAIGAISTDFIRQSGSSLVVGAAATPVKLRGINFRNYLLIEDGNSNSAWIDFGSAYTPNDADLPFNEVPELDFWYLTETFFKDAASMNMNVARIALNYRTFENDATQGDGTPGSYKQSGWVYRSTY
ncbi:MAG: hypothetical protein ACUZ8E_08950 [Candidatus Anammoxibacter sp.]